MGHWEFVIVALVVAMLLVVVLAIVRTLLGRAD